MAQRWRSSLACCERCPGADRRGAGGRRVRGGGPCGGAAGRGQVDALQPRVERALRAYELAVAQISGSVSRSVVADQEADATAALAREAPRGRQPGADALHVRRVDGADGQRADGPDSSRRAPTVAYVQRLVETTSVMAGLHCHR